jgi:hypothetical protein
MTATLPPKVPGVHRWVALATFSVTAGQARSLAAGSAVKLADYNRVNTSLGCVDCEKEWPAEGRCPAGAAPEMEDLTSDEFVASDDARDRLVAVADAIARSGAREFEVGHLEDDSTPLARWYATATYRGTKVFADEHADPVAAAEELLAKLLVGGQCVSCERLVTLPDESSAGSSARCTWARHGDMWVPGCVPADEVEEFMAERRKHK